MPNKRIEQVCQTTDINGNDKLLVVKSGSNVTRSVTVDDFIHDNSICTGEICNNAVTTDKIAPNAVTHVEIDFDAVGPPQIQDNAVTTDKIAPNAVTHVEINFDAVGTPQIQNGAVTTDKIQNNAVTRPKIANGSINGDKIENSSIGPAKLSTGAPQWSSNGAVRIGGIDDYPYDNNASDGAGIALGGISPHEGLIASANVNSTAAAFNRIGTDGWLVDIRKNGTSVGSIAVTSDSTAFNTSSDYRLKEDIIEIDGSIDRLKALKPCNFRWKSDGTRVDGFIAHEAQEVVPEAVTGTKDEVDEEGNPYYQGIDQAKLVPLLTKALQEAVAKIESLETRVAALES